MMRTLRRVSLLLALLAVASGANALTLSTAQRDALKAHIQANSDTNTLYVAGDLQGLADLLNAEAAPVFWVWKTAVTRADIYGLQNDLPVSGAQTGFWNWVTYKNQGATEQNAWVQMFMGDTANFSLQNIRDGVGSIFTGSAAANAQRDHVLAIGRRHATRAERVLATGTGSTASPAILGSEGLVAYTDLIGL